MAQNLFDDLKPCAQLDTLGREGMPQGVHRRAGDPGVLEVLGDDQLNGPGAHAPVEFGLKDRIVLSIRRTNGKVGLQRLAGFPVERDGSLSASLALYPNTTHTPGLSRDTRR